MADSVNITTNPPFEYETWESEQTWEAPEHWLFHNTLTWSVAADASFGATDGGAVVRDMTVAKAETFNVSDKYVVDVSASLVDTVEISDALSRDIEFYRDYAEALVVTQGIGKSVDKESFYETFGIVDAAPVFFCESVSLENLKVDDKISFTTSYNLELAETLKTVDLHSNNPSLPFWDTVVFNDGMVMPANGIYSDMMFEDGEWSMASMKTYMFKGKHVGYENFKTFIAGDYNYEKALFRTTIDTETADRGLIEQWQLTVDVPDISDRGSAEVVDANFELTVNFNKTFHIAPEVVCTVRSGSSNVPITVSISTITETYFKVSLINSLTGKTTTGRFIWSAQGY